ncbi:uncharacterized protein LOC111244882 [Varroa destructor]|uniref:Uncharacterized protein n=1 Tax=Varroa destructor TaxID=109461 RepID=A0A7M7JCY8_VARDE|nr:uncharacterized protein LOC111244882 [Varroa destructor]
MEALSDRLPTNATGHNSWRLVLDTSWQRKCDVRRALSQVVGHCQGNIDRDSLGTGSKGGPTDSENDRKTLLYHQRRREKTEIQGDCIRLADIQTFFVPSDQGFSNVFRVRPDISGMKLISHGREWGSVLRGGLGPA